MALRALVALFLLIHALATGATRADAQDGVANSSPTGAAPLFWPAGERWTLRLDLALAPGVVRSDTCDGCADRWTHGTGGRAAIGGVVHPRVVLGVEAAGSWDGRFYYRTGARDRAPSVVVRAGYLQWYPPMLRHVALRASAGSARYRLSGGALDKAGNWYFRDVRLEGTGFGVAGAWELWSGFESRLGLVPYASWWHVPNARGTRQLRFAPSVPYRAAFGVMQVGAGLTIR